MLPNRDGQWYTDSAATDIEVMREGSRFGSYGALWTKPYVSVITRKLKFTATRQLRNSANEMMGVVAADFEVILDNSQVNLLSEIIFTMKVS
jgi:hypothetical protein